MRARLSKTTGFLIILLMLLLFPGMVAVAGSKVLPVSTNSQTVRRPVPNQITNVSLQFKEMKGKFQLQQQNLKLIISEQIQAVRNMLRDRLGTKEAQQLYSPKKYSLSTNKKKMTRVGFFLVNGEMGSISGTIETATGDPIEDIAVDIYDSIGEHVGYGLSNAEGQYTVNGLTTGDYYVGTWNDQGYVDEWYQDVIPWEGDPAPVHVVAPAETANINFSLEKGGSISGQILDSTGNPIEEVEVYAIESTGNWGNGGMSDADGNYTVNGLTTGDYYVVAWDYDCDIETWYQDATPWEEDPAPVHVELSNDTPNINFVLEEGGVISGRVLDSTGNPLEDVYVIVIDSTGNWGNSDWSDAEGYYRIRCLATNDYYVGTRNAPQGYADEWYQDAIPWGEDPAPVHVDAPGETASINFILEMGGSISGQVLDSTGSPIEGVAIVVYDPGMWMYRYGETDAVGSYTVKGLATGDYYLLTWNDQGYIDEWYQDAIPWEGDPAPVHVDRPNDTPNINFELALGGKITGTITACNTDPPLPVSYVDVYVEDWETGVYIGYGWSDEDGYYMVGGLPTGTYRVCAEVYGGDYVSMCLNEPVSVAIGGTTVQDICLGKGGTITGTVTVCNTDPPLPISDPSIRVEDWETGYEMGYGWSDSEGHYTVDRLPTGTYRVCAGAPSGSDYTRRCSDTPVAVVAESTTVYDICLKKGGSVSGTVICDGCGEGSIVLIALAGTVMDPSQFLGQVTIDGLGGYTIKGLPYDTQMGIHVWYDKEQAYSPPPGAGDFIGTYKGSPFSITESAPDLTGVDITLNKICTADDECIDALFCNGVESCVDDVIFPVQVCQPGGNPCLEGETCVEDSGTCVSPGNCGDNVRDPGEECDGMDYGDKTCADFGFDGGTLTCSAGCTFDTSGCYDGKTIVIDGCNAEVPDRDIAEGLTMSDLIDECANKAHKNHGKFVSCIAHLTNGWCKTNVISGREKGAIMSCAGQADIP